MSVRGLEGQPSTTILTVLVVIYISSVIRLIGSNYNILGEKLEALVNDVVPKNPIFLSGHAIQKAMAFIAINKPIIAYIRTESDNGYENSSNKNSTNIIKNYLNFILHSESYFLIY